MTRPRPVRGVAAGALGVALLLGVTACDIPGLSSGSRTDTTVTSGGQVELPERTVYIEGSRTPSPAPPAVQATPAATTRAPRVDSGNTGERATAAVTCTGQVQEGVMNGLGVVPSSTSATVTWPGAGQSVLRYFLAAVPQTLRYGTQPDVIWQTVEAPAGCADVTATVAGLRSASPYIFWLRVVTTDHVHGGTNDTWIARSLASTTA